MRRLDLGDLFFDVSLLLWCCALVFLTQRGLCSAYVPMLMVFFPLATKLLLSRHFAEKGASVSGLRLIHTFTTHDALLFTFTTNNTTRKQLMCRYKHRHATTTLARLHNKPAKTPAGSCICEVHGTLRL